MPLEDALEREPTDPEPDPLLTARGLDAPRLTVDRHPLFGHRGNVEVVALMELEAKSG